MQSINRQHPERVRDVSISRRKELAPLQGANRLTRSRRSSLRSDLRLLSDNPPGCKHVCFISTEKQSDSASCEPSILLLSLWERALYLIEPSSPVGSSTKNFAPGCPSASSIQMRPPCASTMPRAIANPMPLPDLWSPTSPSRIARKNLSKTRSRVSAEIPGPSSSTLSLMVSLAPGATLTRIVVPGGEYLAALSTRV